MKVGEEELLQLVLLMESVFVIGKDVTQPIMLNSRMERFVDLMLVIWIFQRQKQDCINSEKLIDMTEMHKVFAILEELKETTSHEFFQEKLAEELFRYMGGDESLRAIEWITRMHEIKITEDLSNYALD